MSAPRLSVVQTSTRRPLDPELEEQVLAECRRRWERWHGQPWHNAIGEAIRSALLGPVVNGQRLGMNAVVAAEVEAQRLYFQLRSALLAVETWQQRQAQAVPGLQAWTVLRGWAHRHLAEMMRVGPTDLAPLFHSGVEFWEASDSRESIGLALAKYLREDRPARVAVAKILVFGPPDAIEGDEAETAESVIRRESNAIGVAIRREKAKERRRQIEMRTCPHTTPLRTREAGPAPAFRRTRSSS